MQELNVQPSNQEFTCQTTFSAEPIASLTASILSEEEKQKEKRTFYTNIPNPSSTDPLTRKKEDIENISALLNDYVEIPTTITNAVCIGKPLDGPRFTKVTVSSVEEKSVILRNCCNSPNKSYSNACEQSFITPDLTPM